MVVYPIISRLQWLANWWTETVEFGHPLPTLITTIAVYIHNVILLLWLPLSFFVWRDRRWARWLVAYSALVLAVTHCFLSADLLRIYVSAGLISEMLLDAFPMLLMSAVVFCGLAGESSSKEASNQEIQRTAPHSDA